MSYFKAEAWGKNDELKVGLRRAYEKAYAHQKPLRDKWTRAYLYMRCMHDPTTFENAVRAVGRDNPLDKALFRPLFVIQVLTTKPRLKDALKGMDPPFRLEPEIDGTEGDDGEGEDVRWAQCERYGRYLRWQFRKYLRWDELLDPLLMEAIPGGTGIVKLDWVRRADLAWGMQPVLGAGDSYSLQPTPAPQVPGLEGRQAWAIVEDRPRAQVISPWHWFPDPRGRSLDGRHDNQPSRYCIETATAPIDDLIRDAILDDPIGGWQYPEKGDLALLAQAFAQNRGDGDLRATFEAGLQEWLKAYEGSATEQHDPVRALQAKAKAMGANESNDTEDQRLAALMHFYGAGPDPWYIVRIGGENGDILRKVRGTKHPSLFAPMPYVTFTPKRLPNEMWGMGLIHLLDHLQQEDNAWTNLLLSTFRDSAHGFTVVDKSRGLTVDSFLSQPHRIAEVANPGGLPLTDMFLHVPRPIPNVGALLQMLSRIEDDGNRAGGATDPLQGSLSLGGPVRTNAMMIDQGSRRWGDEAEVLGNQVGHLAEMLDALNKQHIVRALSFRESIGEGQPALLDIGVRMIQRKYQIHFNVRPVVTSESQQLANLMQFSATYGAYPEFNRGETIVEHAKLLHLVRPERFRVVHPKDAVLENEFFASHGFFPWPAQPHDDHVLHDQEHKKMVAWVQSLPPDVAPIVAIQLAGHEQSHWQYMGMAIAGGATPGAPAQMPTPSAQTVNPGSPGSPATQPFPYDLPGTPAPEPEEKAPND